MLERQSPLTHADKIKTPLLVVHGANDPRVKQAESDRIVVSLRDRNFPVEYIVAPDEGHGFARPVNNMATFAAMERFFAKHLGGRFQETMTPEVEARLKEITVDVKKVELPKPVEVSAASPKPAVDLQPGTASYKGSIAVGGQSIPLSVSTEIKEDGGAWVASETASLGAMGDMSDVSTIEKGTLLLRRRAVKQGPVTIEMEVKDNKATGTMTMNGQPRPISADLGGPLFADGAGANAVMAALPLAEGYATTFRNFDLQTQKPKVSQLKVAATEQVTVPAGAFDAYRVEVTSDNGGKSTVWVDKTTRRVVKVSSVLPQMGGAVLTLELQK
jgi:hypothetical protein